MKQIENQQTLLKQIDLDNIKNLDEFKKLYLSKYQDDKAGYIKLKEIVSHMNKSASKYNLTKIYYEICLGNWNFGGPGLNEILAIIYDNKIIDGRDENYSKFSEKKEGENGEWRCNGCKGKLGHLETILKNGINYEYFTSCPTCEGTGYSKGNMYWVSYDHTPEEVSKKVEELDK